MTLFDESSTQGRGIVEHKCTHKKKGNLCFLRHSSSCSGSCELSVFIKPIKTVAVRRFFQFVIVYQLALIVLPSTKSTLEKGDNKKWWKSLVFMTLLACLCCFLAVAAKMYDKKHTHTHTPDHQITIRVPSHCFTWLWSVPHWTGLNFPRQNLWSNIIDTYRMSHLVFGVRTSTKKLL